MANFTALKTAKSFSQQEAIALQTFSNGQPFLINTTDVYEDVDFKAITIIDSAEFTTLTAIDSEGAEFDYLDHCNLSGVKLYAADGFPSLTSPNKFIAVTLASGAIIAHR